VVEKSINQYQHRYGRNFNAKARRKAAKPQGRKANIVFSLRLCVKPGRHSINEDENGSVLG
jgi:hypothetical protein